MPDIDPKYYREVFPLTKRQAEFLELLKGYYGDKGSLPSFRKLVYATGFKSTWAITKLYEALIKKGYITKIKKGVYQLEEVK